MEVKKLLFIAGLIFSLATSAQDKNLNLILVNQEDLRGNDVRIPFEQFIADIKQTCPDFNYTKINYNAVNYGSAPEAFSESTIGSMKAANFIICNSHLARKLIPIFIVKKNGQDQPYYNAYFIVNKNSQIDSLTSDQIKKIYYVDESSGSGYFAPLHELYLEGVITRPTLAAAKEKFRPENVLKENSHQNVIQRVNDDNTYSSVGFCSELPGNTSNAKVLLRYALLPQDVIFVSPDLERFIPQIKDWFATHERNGLFNNTSTHISGLEEFKAEHAAAYKSLEKIINSVEHNEQTSDNKNPALADAKTPVELLHLAGNLPLPELIAIFGFFATIFSVGLTIGLKYPKIVQAIKSE